MKSTLFAFALVASISSIAQASPSKTFQVCADNVGQVYMADEQGNLTGAAASKLDTANIAAGADVIEMTVERGLDPKTDAKLIANLRKDRVQLSGLITEASQNLKRMLPLYDAEGQPLLANIRVSGATDEKIMFTKASNGISSEIAIVCSMSMPTSSLEEVRAVLNR